MSWSAVGRVLHKRDNSLLGRLYGFFIQAHRSEKRKSNSPRISQ